MLELYLSVCTIIGIVVSVCFIGVFSLVASILLALKCHSTLEKNFPRVESDTHVILKDGTIPAAGVRVWHGRVRCILPNMMSVRIPAPSYSNSTKRVTVDLLFAVVDPLRCLEKLGENPYGEIHSLVVREIDGADSSMKTSEVENFLVSINQIFLEHGISFLRLGNSSTFV